jgi:ABC-type multidrug transport system fused ATPase/permease subunit
MRLEILGNIVILSAALLGVVAKQYNLITAGVIGMSLSYSLNMTNMLNFLLKSLSDVETNIVSVERISEFSNINQEDDLDKNTDGEMLPRNWPAYGSILIKDLYVKYRPDLDYALMDINAEIRPGEKIGVCGRTGSGKTTLASTLFRLIEPSSGQLFIDNINIGRLGLHRIREALTIIPQDPLLFSGSIRFNLDPFHKNSDSDLWQALADSNLKIFVQSLPNGLSHEISEGGQNIRFDLCLLKRNDNL